MWTGIFLFLLKIGARRQIKYQFGTGAFIDNLNVLTDSDLERIAHPDTLAYLLSRLSPDEVSAVIGKMVNRLIRMKCLERDRLSGQYYMVAIDGTGYINFGHTRHCARCSSKTTNGKTIYYHPVLEAKLITTRGMALSVETEFIERQDGVTKEDCELRAFYRLAEKLKKRFPQLKICLSLDALYAAQEVFEICKNNDWNKWRRI